MLPRFASVKLTSVSQVNIALKPRHEIMYCTVIFCFTVFLAIAGANIILLRQQFLNDTSNLECVLKGNDDSWSAAAWTTDNVQTLKDTIKFSAKRFEYDPLNKETQKVVELKPLENCNDTTKKSQTPLCPINYGWKWTKISEIQQNLGPVLDYRWEGKSIMCKFNHVLV
ncbi:hypothetical protein B566_EDAN004933 [Ephemera danica]|nr:hypothetical protein B566_EDAN004933 [Ephemera danica]